MVRVIAAESVRTGPPPTPGTPPHPPVRPNRCYSHAMSTSRTRKRTPTPTALLYVRVSATEAQSDSDLSLAAQERTLRLAAEIDGYTDVRVIVERHSASRRLPLRDEAMALLRSGAASAMYVTKVDRLSRNGVRDVLAVADAADREGWRLRLLEVNLDTKTPSGRLVLTIMAGIARFESERRSERMREYHQERRDRGQRAGVEYGQRVTHPASARQRDQARCAAATVARILRMRDQGLSLRTIAATLTAESVDGRTWNPTLVARIIRRHERDTAAAAA